MLSNSEIKKITALQKKKYRSLYNSFLIEGEKLIQDAINVNFPLEKIIISPKYFTKNSEGLLKTAEQYHIEIVEVSEKQLNKISYVKTPQPIVAIGKILSKTNNPEELIKTWNKIVVFEQLQDPGNLGTLIRAADWFGIDGIILGEGSADLYNPKVVRGSMGSLFRRPIISDINISDLLPLLRVNNIKTLAADINGESILTLNPVPLKWALLLGNESHGISSELYDKIDNVISIPGNSNADSLNVAMSGAILLYHLTQLK